MQTKFFPKWLRLLAAILLLFTAYAASPAQADGPVPGGIITTGNTHSCALKPDGSVDCWGSNNGGFNQADDQPGPYTQLSTGVFHTCALTPSGALDCWGSNTGGQGNDLSGPYTQVSVGFYQSCVLTPSGMIHCQGANNYGQAEDQPGPYTQLDSGAWHNCGLTSSGTVDCWGNNENGQAQDQPGPYTEISAGGAHTCALTPSGAAECWGGNSWGEAEDQLGPYIEVSAGIGHTCALKPDGSADCWGFNGFGQAEDQPGPYTQISADWVHTCALRPSGAVDCWGRNDLGQSEDQPGPYGPYNPSIDTIPPLVTVTGVTEGSSYILGAVPQAGCSTTDEGSGVAVEASLSLSGGNTLGVGSFTATCSGALDKAGNPGNTAVIHYNVAFLFTGFTAPVDNPPTVNIAKAGQIIPLRWRITDASGNPITNLTDVTVTATDRPCQAGMAGDLIEEYATSNSGLQNLGNGYYQWNWKTPTSYANSCKSLSLDLGEGAGNEHTALFQFR